MIRFSTGNMFDVQVDAIFNTFNLVGETEKCVARHWSFIPSEHEIDDTRTKYYASEAKKK